jgi:hypothetical protein
VIDVARFYMYDRFASFLLMPMLALMALGLVTVFGLLGRVGDLRVAGPAVAVALAVFGAYKVVVRADELHAEPLENTRGVAAIVGRSAPEQEIFSNTLRPVGFEYYLDRPVRTLPLDELRTLFCERRRAFVYIEHGHHTPLADTACLRERGAVRVGVAHRGTYPLAVWFATPLR